VLDYHRFASDSVASYQQLQVDLLRRLSLGKPITTNFMGTFTDLDYHRLAEPLDFVSWDSYPTGYAEMMADRVYLPTELRPKYAYDAGDPVLTGFCHDITRGLKQSPFWVMEQQAGNINWSRHNTGVRPGTLRLWTWHALACGAEAVLYFRWRASLNGQEQFHSALLNHDGTLAAGYSGAQSMLAERDVMAEIASIPHRSQVAILLSYEDAWGIGLQPHRVDFSYLRHLYVYYRALQGLGIQADIVSPLADLNGYRIVVAPTVFINRTQVTAALERYVRKGGTLVLGVRSGFKTESNRVSEQPLPGELRYLVGATVSDWQALPPGVAFDLSSEISGLGGQADFWAEALKPPLSACTEEEGEAQVFRCLARYTSGPLTGRVALSEHAFGAGRVLYCAWYPQVEQAQALLAHLVEETGVVRISGLPHGLVARRMGPYTILLNFSEQTLSTVVGDQEIAVPSRDIRWLKSATE
jgi:beta-galactosidase